MESLSVTELRHALDYLLKLATCPVCHETLTPEVALCVRGHPVCISCHQRLTKPECPLCRGAFSGVEPSGFIRQVIESLPHPCRHIGCDSFVIVEDDHERFCAFKPTKCRYCNVEKTVAGNEIVEHLKSSHTSEADKYLSLFGYLENGMPFNPKEKCSVFTPILAGGHFFWGEMKNEPTSGKLTAFFHPVPNGKTTTVFKGFVSLEGSYSAEVKLNMDSKIDPYVENCISIPTSILHKFTVNDKLEYKITVEVVRPMLETITMLLSGIKSGISYEGQKEIPPQWE